MSQKAAATKRGRLSLRVNLRLLAKMHAFVKKHDTTLTRIVEDHFRAIVEAEEAESAVPYDAESIR